MMPLPGVITNHQKLVTVALALLALNEAWMFAHYSGQQDSMWDTELSYVFPEYKEEWHSLDALIAQHWRNFTIMCSAFAFFSIFSLDTGAFTLEYWRKFNEEANK